MSASTNAFSIRASRTRAQRYQKTRSNSTNSSTKCVLRAHHNCVREDRTSERRSGNTGSQAARGLPIQTEVTLVSVPCELSNVSHNVWFFDNDLARINSTTAQNNMVDTCTVLAAYSATHPCHACCLCFSFLFSCGRPLVGKRTHPHVLPTHR